jgi:hypothetical protein
LSNPAETINLGPDSRAGNRAGRRSRQRSIDALAAIRRQTHIPGTGSTNGRSGSGNLEKAHCWVLRDRSRQGRSRGGQDVLSGYLFLDFERLSHVAANLQSVSVRAGKVIGFCSPNEQ